MKGTEIRVQERLRAAGVTRPGPESVTWKVNREILVVAGWGRAILLQLAHPLVAAGVDAHSGFRHGTRARMGRLRSTVGAMAALSFGDEEEAIAAAARINAIHDRVCGRIQAAAGVFAAGTTYSAHDPELLLWVHATLLDSMLLTYQRLVAPLGEAERDRYCAEAAVMEPLLDIPAGLLPRSTAELEAYARDVLGDGTIAVTARSRALARAILFPPPWRLLWPVFRPVQLLTIGLLPPAVRQAYGFDWSPRDERALARWTAALRWVHRRMPAAAKHWRASRKRPVQRGVPLAEVASALER